MSQPAATLLPGTLEMLILKVVSAEPEHGWGIGNRLAHVSDGVFDVNQGSLYPALQRLLRKGWIKSEWRRTENGRRARYYATTKSGARQLVTERESWARQVEGVRLVLDWAT